MKYPMLDPSFSFRRINKREYWAKDEIMNDEFTMTSDIVHFARKLNGKRDPYTIDESLSREDVDRMLELLDRYCFLRYSKVLSKSFGSISYTLWVPKKTKKLYMYARLYNALLNVLWLPVFCLGIWMYWEYSSIEYGGSIWLGLVFGTLIGAFLHELGHLFSGLTYGASVFEMGAMIENFLPGAYVLVDSDVVKSRKGRVNINAAGIKSNILLAGMFLLLAVGFPTMDITFFSASIANVILALINLLFVKGVDGVKVITEYLGTLDIEAGCLLFDRGARRKLLAKGATGYAVLAINLVFALLQLVWPLLIVINIAEVVVWFF